MDHTPVTSTSTMRAITQSQYGTSDLLRLTDVPVPCPGEGQVLLRVHAAGLDRGTEHLMTGKPYAVRLAMGVRRPRNPVLGRDVAGTRAPAGAGPGTGAATGMTSALEVAASRPPDASMSHAVGSAASISSSSPLTAMRMA